MNAIEITGSQRETLLKLLEQQLGNSNYQMLVDSVGEDQALQMLIESAKQREGGLASRPKGHEPDWRWVHWLLGIGVGVLCYFFGLWSLKDNSFWEWGGPNLAWEWWYPYAALPAGLMAFCWFSVCTGYGQQMVSAFFFSLLGSFAGVVLLKFHHFGWAIFLALCLLIGSPICLAIAANTDNPLWKADGIALLLVGMWLLALAILAWIF